jgi:hypothetical protein
VVGAVFVGKMDFSRFFRYPLAFRFSWKATPMEVFTHHG